MCMWGFYIVYRGVGNVPLGSEQYQARDKRRRSQDEKGGKGQSGRCERWEFKDAGKWANGDGAGFNRISRERVKWVEFERNMKGKKVNMKAGSGRGFQECSLPRLWHWRKVTHPAVRGAHLQEDPVGAVDGEPEVGQALSFRSGSSRSRA